MGRDLFDIIFADDGDHLMDMEGEEVEDDEFIIVSFLPFIKKTEEKFSRDRRAKKHKADPMPLYESVINERFKRAADITGEERVENFYNAIKRYNQYSIDTFGHPIPAMHLKIMETMLTSLLQKMYGMEYERNLVKLLRKYHEEMFRTACFVCLPRRYGKTFITALVVAIYLYTQPGAKINVYSISRRTSSMFAAQVVNFLRILGGSNIYFKTKNQEEVTVENMYGKATSLGLSTLMSYPASEEVSIRDLKKSLGHPPTIFFLFFFVSFFQETT